MRFTRRRFLALALAVRRLPRERSFNREVRVMWIYMGDAFPVTGLGVVPKVVAQRKRVVAGSGIQSATAALQKRPLPGLES